MRQKVQDKMSSLYAKYIKERTDDYILEIEEGFATYRYLNEYQVYIVDLYVLPEYRKQGIASKLGDAICLKARRKGYTELVGTVCPSANNATESALVLIAYGMKIDSSSNNVIVFKKDI